MAVVLSGTGQNGTVGARSLKEAGGLVLAQTPEDALFDEMPRSVLASGVVDHVAPAGELGHQVIAYAERLHRVQLPDRGAQPLSNDNVRTVQYILAQVRVRTGHDFSHYKWATVLRRLARRLHVVGADNLEAYLDYLRLNPGEAQELLADLLISVTSFFRDPEAFQMLAQEVIPTLFEGKGPREEVRVWVAGCATGEEAYTLAMLLSEHAATLAEPPLFQVLASDLNKEAIRTAREGIYPASIEVDVTPERLQRFFHKQPQGYRVREELRERVLFTPHSLLKDPPFSRLDLVSCRNLMIYLQRNLQRQVLTLFHYTLVPGGVLFMGASETAEMATNLFQPLYKTTRIYRRLPAEAALPHLPVTVATSLPATRPATPAGRTPAAEENPAQWHQRLRALEAPPSVLVDEQHEMIHLSENMAPFLRLGGGEPTRNLLRVVVTALRPAVQMVLFQARRHQENSGQQPKPDAATPPWAVAAPVQVTLDGTLLRVGVRGQAVAGTRMVHLYFESLPLTPRHPSADPPVPDNQLVLEEAMQETREQLQLTIEEFETSREELRAQNEELQSVNEELRSAAEELETSKEESQSMAEELQMVNQEMKAHLDELKQAKSDLENLIAATEIATLFLDRRLQIKWFTPHIRRHFHVRSSDMGRPLAELAPKFKGLQLIEDAEAALEQMEIKEREVEGEDNRWYLLHVRPYRSWENRLDGVVLTFVDITERKAAEIALHQTAEVASFRATVADALRPLVSPEVIRIEVCRHLGQHLGASRVRYGEVTDDAHVVIGQDYARGVARLTERFRMDALGPALVEALRAGRTLVVADVATNAELTAEEKAVCAGVEVGALVGVPLVKEGRLVAVLTVHHTLPYRWTSHQVALVEETAERTWVAVERARAQEARRQSEERYRLMVEGAREYAIFMADTHGKVVSWSAGAERILGHTEEQAVGMAWEAIFTPEDQQAGAAAQELATAAGEGQVNDERWYLRRDGSRFWATGVVTAVSDAEGRPRGFVKVLRDNTQRKAAQEGMQRSQALYQTLAANLPQSGVFVVDHDLRYLMARGQAITQSGLLPEALEGKTIYEALDESMARRYTPYFRRTLAGQTFHWEHTAHNRTYMTHGVPLRDAAGEVFAALAVSYDITERKAAEEALRDREERLRLIMESALDYAIFTLDLDGRIVSWNRGAERLLGYPPEDILGQSGQVVFTAEDQAAGAMEEELAKAAHQNHAANERWHVRRDGSRFWGSGYTMPLLTEGGQARGFLKIMVDNTQRQLMEASLRQAKEAAEAAAQAKEDFLAHMSHEIRTPLNAVVGLTHLLTKMDALPAQAENLEALRLSAENLRALINDILDFSKLEAGMSPLALTRVQLPALVSSVQKVHQQRATELDNALVVKVDERLPEAVMADQLKLSQVLHNLVGNAVKFTHGGTITLALALQREEPGRHWVTFTVTDTGIGIAEDKLTSIFDSFTQADSSTARQYGGTGLGLSITRRLLTLMDSQIEVESAPGKGSRFYFTLPLDACPAQDDAAPPASEQQAAAYMNQLRVLVVEDLEINRRLLAQMLKEWWPELRLDEATGGREAVEKAAQTQYDFILMDIRMPGMDGYETTAAIRALPGGAYARVPVLALTADTSSEVNKHPQAALFADVVTKPFDPEKLRQTLLRYDRAQVAPPATEGAAVARPVVADLQKLETLYKHDKKRIGGLLEKFVQEFVSCRTRFQTAMRQRDQQAMRQLVHDLGALLAYLSLESALGFFSHCHALLSENAPPEDVDQARRQGEALLTEVITSLRRQQEEPVPPSGK